MFLFALYFSLLTACLVSGGEVVQSSSPGETAVVKYDVTAGGGESICGILHATGDLTLIDTALDFDSHFYDFFAQAADMFLKVEVLDESGNSLQCFIYGGYDYNSDGCGKPGKWPQSWHSTSDGAYSAVANVTRAHFSGTLWSICIGNGWTGSAFDVTYKGSLSIPSLMTTIWAPSLEPSAEPSSLPTSTMYPTMTSEVPSGQPSSRPSSPPQQTVPTSEPSSSPPDVMTLTSSCGQPVILQFDAYLRGAQSACLNFNANSSLHSLNMTMDYGGNDDEIAGDMAFIVYHSTSLIGVQVGGHDYYIPTVVYAGPWPSSWQSGSPGLYTAAVDVSAGNLEGGEGYYYACILNGWFYGELEHYNGTVQLDSLITQCGSQSEFPTSAPSEQSERYSSDDGGDDEQTAIILASVLVPGLLIITAVIAFVMWRRRINEKAERQSMVATELGDITKDVAHSALAMSPSIANPLLGSSEEEGADTGKQRPREEQGGEDSPLW